MKIRINRAAQLKSGMTLLEIVIVVAIIAVIMGASIGMIGGLRENANDNATRMKINGMRSLLESYRSAAGSYPTEAQGLQALVTKPTTSPVPRRWRQQMASIPVDPWNQEYIYKYPGSIDKTSYEIISKGSDQELGTDDDISSQDDL